MAGADLTVETQKQKHYEEEDSPEGGQGHHGHGFGVGDEGQSGTWWGERVGGGTNS